MGETFSKCIRDPFGFGNTSIPKKFAKFAELNQDLSNMRVAITGGTKGIGLAAAQRLASMGATVIVFGRDKVAGQAAVQAIGPKAEYIPLDVSNFESIINVHIQPVDVLIHNAGDMLDERRSVQWPAGPVDETFALMLAGPYLLNKVIKSAYTIWISSGGMLTAKLNTKDALNPPENPFDGMKQYARCKRGQVVVAKRLGQQSMHPGWVDTEAVRKRMPKFYEKERDILRTPAQGADTIVWMAATRPSKVAFWFDRKEASEFPVPFTGHSVEEENKILAELERLTVLPAKAE
jgi:NAD(P)-dependent dehydrogenase (short-subunit alcohol dehydrogenase family)